jgi:hypothetical protein
MHEGSSTKFIKELQAWFSHVVNDALDIIYSHYVIFVDCDESINNHLHVVNFYFEPQRKWMLVRLSNLLASFCVHLIWICKNPCSRWWWKTMCDLIWALLILSILSLKCESWSQLKFFIPFHNMLKYIKLAKIVMIQVLTSMEV